MTEKKIGIINDDDFALMHIPPYPKPTFISFEHPIRIKSILEILRKEAIFDHSNVLSIKPFGIEDNILELTHSKYHIDSIKKISKRGGGLIDEEIFVTPDTFFLAKKAVGGAISAIENVIKHRVNQSIALIRPPGHHAYREKSSGLCIFNNIATSIFYLRQRLSYSEKIAIIDIDNHFGDGLAHYFYEDPSVLYVSIHEFDFSQTDVGFIDEIGEGRGKGLNINIPVPEGLTSRDFLELIDFVLPLIREYKPDLLIIAAGFDMYFADPIGNCLLSSETYFKFTKKILEVATELCDGKLSFILEGGYSIIGLQYCIKAVIKALLNEEYKPPEFEMFIGAQESKKVELDKIKKALIQILKPYWNCL